MKNYQKTTVCGDERAELHDVLGLTGAEVSVNYLPAGASIPFVHAHKQNEEIYAVIEGKGKVEIDGDVIELAKGDWLRVAPAAKRQFFAAADQGIRYICIQAKAGSLEGYTMTDAAL